MILDEAQKVADIGTTLKLLVDTQPDIQIIATGSSSFDLSNRITEPLTGRNIKFTLLPISLTELSYANDEIMLSEKLEDLLRFGMYPDIIDRPEDERRTLLDALATDYLYRDVLMFESLRNTELLNGYTEGASPSIGSGGVLS